MCVQEWNDWFLGNSLQKKSNCLFLLARNVFASWIILDALTFAVLLRGRNGRCCDQHSERVVEADLVGCSSRQSVHEALQEGCTNLWFEIRFVLTVDSEKKKKKKIGLSFQESGSIVEMQLFYVFRETNRSSKHRLEEVEGERLEADFERLGRTVPGE